MKKKKNAFTLIELLAIIVILAIIAVITVPIILNIIENSRKGAAIDSAYGFKDSISKYYVTKLSETPNYNFTEGNYTISKDGSNSKITLKTDNNDYHNISVSGSIPSGGWIAIEKNAVTNGQVQIGEYCVVISDGVVGEAVKETCPSQPAYKCVNPNYQSSPEEWFVFNSSTGTITGLSDIYYSLSNKPTEISIPCSIDNTPVRVIGQIFGGTGDSDSYPNVKKVTIPSEVKKIVNQAFSFNTHIETIEFDDNSQLEEIGTGAFSYIYNLKSINVPFENLKKIGSQAFTFSNISLNNVTINNEDYFESEAFYGVNIQNLNVNVQSTKAIVSSLYGCLDMSSDGRTYTIKNLTFGSNVKNITQTFNGCGIETLTFNQGLETISGYFGGNSFSEVTIPSTTSVSEGVFDDNITITRSN